MKNIKVLDCTLRDGGYCNGWKFKHENIHKILAGLFDADIDIVECGFLTNKMEYSKDFSKYNHLEELNTYLHKKADKECVVMQNFGEYRIEDIPDCKDNSIVGIRLAFHKPDMDEAIKYCGKLKEKGYHVYVQPMVSLNYSDKEFIELIKAVNEIEPYAFYIVDSFGMMKRKNLLRLFYLVENNLDENIWIGFHSHNNMQMAYSNAQHLVELPSNRNVIIDCSILGMGRGAGNLNTELFLDYLNDNFCTKYKIKPLLNVMDEVINRFYQTNYWGYSLPNYLSAKHNTHPNYAMYLADKNTLTIDAMDNIFFSMKNEKRAEYDQNYIEELYLGYMAQDVEYDNHIAEFKEQIKNKKILLIAPGKSSEEERIKVAEIANAENIITIGINSIYPYAAIDYVFVSNMKRYRQLNEEVSQNKLIITSNIPSKEAYIKMNYSELLNNIEYVRDNAGLMLIKFLVEVGAKEIFLAGMDGYSHDEESNYRNEDFVIKTSMEIYDRMNCGMEECIKKYQKSVNIQFVTMEKNIHI